MYTNLYPDESRIRRPFEGMPGNGRMMQRLDKQGTRVQS
jgi:hypothetical protein